MLKPNTLVHDRYRIVRLMGQGGFGAVYEALDERLNCRVALKLLMRVSDRISRQFTNEAQLLANLHHPALPRVTDHFADAAGPCLVMDYIPGDDLATLLYDRNAPFPLDQVLRWGDQLLDVLHYLHSRQPPIIHRDLKPQNLKLRPDGSLILLDFGLAKGQAGDVQSSSLASSMTAFTRGFAPPEQVEGTGTDARSDLYALGATLYCLLCNTPPPEAQTRLLTVMRGRGDALQPAHTLNPAVPETISQVLQQAMALEMDHRPPSAQVLRGMLQAAGNGIVPVQHSVATEVARETTPTEIARQSAATEIESSDSADPGNTVAALYEQGVALMLARQWAEALQRFEGVERQVPRYRDTRTLRTQVRQELAQASGPRPEAPAVPDHAVASEQHVRPTNPVIAPVPDGSRHGQQRTPRIWLWSLAGGGVLLAAVLALVAFRVLGNRNLIDNNLATTSTAIIALAASPAATGTSAAGTVNTPEPSAAAATATPTSEPTATPEPTSEPTATQAPTAEPTATPRPITVPTQESAPFIVQAYNPDAGGAATPLTVLDYEEPKKPGTYRWQASKTMLGKDLRIQLGWCTTDQATLTENLKHLNYELSIDGFDVKLSQLRNYRQEDDRELHCSGYDGVVKGLTEGPHVVASRRTISEPINDGIDTFPAGVYTDEYEVLVADPGFTIRAVDRSTDANLKHITTLAGDWQEPKQPGDYEWNVSLAAGENLYVSIGWCATSEAIVKDNVSYVGHDLEIDGFLIDIGEPSGEIYKDDRGVYCRTQYEGVVTGLKPGQHSYVESMYIVEDINDGQDEYKAGLYNSKFLITVQ